ncbi:DNA polymerase III subunit alpha [Mycoplasma phocoeninasale]|uniref:DNA-directed DNA polymerase n=1 Tax=Mycoplasma phocoeninasale TaxID=2726117 RepID=A0A858U051_9MOLU|nr:DNA polymerase III subunit alpha [Mycoplasma phocoeninasale]QJG66444.1 DNA polymerase III subunit alpha [Mycoplasma phocoeninasale]
MKLINLHLNTTYSFLKSCIQPEEFIDNLKKSDNEYFAVTEHHNLFSLAYFKKLCEGSSLKPIFGLECDVEIEGKLYKFIVFAKNIDDFEILKNLSYYLLSNHFIKFENLSPFSKLIFIEHPIFGYFKRTNKKILLENHYYSLLPIDFENSAAALLSFGYDKCLLINHNAIFQFSDNEIIATLNLMRKEEHFHDIYEPCSFKLENEKKDAVLSELVNNTNEFAKSIYFEIPYHSYSLPKFQNDENLSSIEYLQNLLKKAITTKFSKDSWGQDYQIRLNHEFSVIKKMRLEDYFLIIQDWIKWSKNNDIAIGPGRGSAAGSLISYLLNITNVDPIRFNLIFERFLNIERVSMPDIDVDVQDDRRQDVINYLVNKYGFDNVANIVTFSSLGKKSAIRDVMRVNNISPKQIDSISKLISPDDKNLLEEYQNNSKFSLELARIDSEDSNLVDKILNVSNRISGFYRQSGTHAAGLVISSKPIIKFVPTLMVDETIQQTQVSMEYLEKFGLIKMDILGLKTLTTIKEIKDLIEKNLNIKVDLDNIPLNDQKTFSILSAGNSIGIFQLESAIMIRALEKIKVNDFEDIVAIISLNRPGPMVNIPKYAARKFGNETVPKINPEYDKIVANTYGIIVYQEQIMQIAQTVANMSFSEADNFRRIISKKKSDEMEDEKQKFINRSIQNNYSIDTATMIFKSIEKFADYGFNRSHAISYALISYQMAYLKAHYPLEFYAACISSAHGAHETISKYVNEAKKMNIRVVSPNIVDSEINAVIKDNAIILPLNMIKGIGSEIVKLVVNNRNENKSYINFQHALYCLLGSKSLGIATIRTLIEANAMRIFNINQQTLLKEIESENSDLMLWLETNKNHPWDEIKDQIINYKPTNIFENDYKIEEENERRLLGQVYNASRTSNYEKVGSRFNDMHVGNEYVTTAVCLNVKLAITKQNKNYLILTFQDSTQTAVAFMWNANDEKYNEIKNLKDKLVEIKVIKDRGDKIILKDWKIRNE